MSEKMSENVFRSYKKQLIKKLGKKGLYDTDINTVGKELFKTKWLGCHASDKIVVSKIGYQILNVDTSKQAGSHWIGIYTTHKNCYIYDSFGRPSSKLIRNVTQKLRKKGIKIYDSDPDAEQRGNSEICGQLSLSWLMVVKILGIKNAMLI